MSFTNTQMITNRLQQFNQLAQQIQQLSSEINQMVQQLPVSSYGTTSSVLGSQTGMGTQTGFSGGYQGTGYQSAGYQNTGYQGTGYQTSGSQGSGSQLGSFQTGTNSQYQQTFPTPVIQTGNTFSSRN